MTLPQYVGADSINATTGAGETTGVTLQVSLNGAAFAAPANTPAHVADGFWRVELNATERDNAQVDVKVTKSGAVPQTRSYVNQAKQGTLDVNVTSMNSDVIGNAQIAAGAITSSEAPNLDAAVSSRLAPSTPGRTLVVAANNSAKIDFDLAVGTLSSGQIDNGALNGKGDWLNAQQTANALDLAPAGPAAAGSVNHVLPLGNAPSAGALITGGTGFDQINTNQGATDANVWGWQDEPLSGTKMIENATTTPNWTQASLNKTGDVIGTRQVPDAIASPGQRPTYDQALYLLSQEATDFEITDNGNGTSTLTIKKPDNTTLATLTLNGDQTTPPTLKARAT